MSDAGAYGVWKDAWLATAVDLMEDGALVCDGEGRILAANRTAELLTGLARAELVGQRLSALGGGGGAGLDALRQMAWERGPDATPEPELLSGEVLWRRVDGSQRMLAAHARWVDAGSLLVWRDVTDERESDESLQSSARLHQMILANVSDGILAATRDRILFANERLANLTGRTVADLIGRPPGIVWDGDLGVMLEKAADTEGPGGRRNGSLRRADGTLAPVEVVYDVAEMHGEPVVLAAVRDIRERIANEELSARMAALSQRLSAAVTLGEVAEVLLETADDLVGWDAAFVNVFASDVQMRLLRGHTLVPLLHYDEIGGKRQRVEIGSRQLPAHSYTMRCVTEGPLVVQRGEGEGSQDPSAIRFGDLTRTSRSLIFVPIRGSEGVVGVMSLQSYTEGSYGEAELRIIHAISDTCADAFERTRTMEFLRLLEAAIRHAHDIVIITQSNPESETGTSIIYVNDAFEHMTGFSHEEVLGKSTMMLQGPDTHPETLARLRQALEQGRPITLELVQYRKDGKPYEVECSIFPIEGASGQGKFFVSVQRDITERKLTEKELVHRAFHDPLTGLANRARFEERLRTALSRHARLGGAFAVFLLDLDTFKNINDTHGHLAGDEVLREVARRLERCVRPTDTVARLGGDEFALLIEPTPHAGAAEQVAERVVTALIEPIHIEGTRARLSASLGVAMWNPWIFSTDELLARADQALYAAKAAGKGCYRIAADPMTGS